MLDLTDYLRSCYKSVTSSTFTLSGRSIWWFCHETWILKDTVLVTRSDIKPSLVSLNCASRDLAANPVPRIGEKRGSGRGISPCSGNARRSCSSCHERLLFLLFFYRLAHRSDCLDKNLYPLLTHKHRFTTQKCSVCHVFIGRCVSVFPSQSAWTNQDFESSFPPQMVHHRRPVGSERPLPLLRQVLPNAALWRPGKQAGRIPGLPICGPRRFQLTLLSERQFNAVWYSSFISWRNVCECFFVDVLIL